MTLENLLYNIGRTAIRNKVINYSAAGSSIFELNAETIVDYPMLFISPTGNHEVRINTTDYEITLYYLDRLLRDSANDIQIFSTAVEQLKLVMRMIENIEGVVEVSDTYNISNFSETEKMNDSVAGAFCTVTITVINVSECSDIQTIDSFTKFQEKTVIIDENGEYEITYDSNYEGLAKVEVIVDVPDTNGDYDEGYDDGKQEGKEEGYNEGYGVGKTDGYGEGLETGRVEGYHTGYETGREEGVQAYVETLPTLNITENGTYDTVNKGVEVNVVPKIKLADYGMKLGHSNFTEIPENLDFNGFTDMSYLFFYCSRITTIPEIDTSTVTNMYSTFSGCFSLKTIPLLNTISVTDMRETFYGCSSLTTIPEINTSSVTNMQSVFDNCRALTTLPELDCSSISSTGYNSTAWFGYSELPNLVNVGGFKNLKIKSDSDYGLKKLPNLTYESCINILNGLYDFTGNGETPNSNQGKLKVHANFLTTVGEEISIGINKGWVITS